MTVIQGIYIMFSMLCHRMTKRRKVKADLIKIRFRAVKDAKKSAENVRAVLINKSGRSSAKLSLKFVIGRKL